MKKQRKSPQNEKVKSEAVTAQQNVENEPKKVKQRIKYFWLKMQNKIVTLPYKELWHKFKQTAKSFDIKKIKLASVFQKIFLLCKQIIAKIDFALIVKKIKDLAHWVSGFWKVVVAGIFVFCFCFYFIGSQIVERVDVKTQCNLNNKGDVAFNTADCMAFLVKREVDDKMWTPNLPMIFPAYVLDNMPNFQMGIVAAVKDATKLLVKFENNTLEQQKNIDKAYKLLSYSPKVWLMSHQSAFKLAPSSNSQYRKAAKELRKYANGGKFEPNVEILIEFLINMQQKIQRIIHKNEEYQEKQSAQMFDFKADDLFYFAKGYAFSWWQMSKIMATDFKPIIVQKNIHYDWEYMTMSLQKAADLQPRVVRNGKNSSLITPNHLMIQNYYLLKTIVAIDDIRRLLLKDSHDN